MKMWLSVGDKSYTVIREIDDDQRQIVMLANAEELQILADFFLEHAELARQGKLERGCGYSLSERKDWPWYSGEITIYPAVTDEEQE